MNTIDITPPGTSDTKKQAQIDEMRSSLGSAEREEKKKKKDKTAGKMLDSDGFEIAVMEAEDFENLTLEEKILCGFYTAKPFNKGAYPIDNLNMAIVPKLNYF